MTQKSLIQKRIQLWKNLDFSVQKEIEELQDKNPLELENRFSSNLSFGTAGARAFMGVGTNRFNIYTIRLLTHAVSQYLLTTSTTPSVVIGYDVRNNSKLFAEEAAKVLAAYNIRVYLFSQVVTIGLVSFAIRHQKASLGIMITASHNPKEYNGFKVYAFHGGQILNDVANEIAKKSIEDPRQVKISLLSDKNIHYFYDEIKKEFLKQLQIYSCLYQQNQKEGKKLGVVYTNLHGGGITLLPDAFLSWGLNNLSLVEEQKEMNGNFPFAPSPNPEDNIALELGIKKLINDNKDLLIATDPDGDRLGVVINHHHEAIRLSGNQIAALLLYHILTEKTKSETLVANSAIVKSIVTSPLLEIIASFYNVKCFNTLTGFKYVADLIHLWEQTHKYSFVMGAEESCGYLCVNFVRDKEAVSAACFLAEFALSLKKNNKTLLDALYDIYEKFGVFREKTISVPLTEKNKKFLSALRIKPPHKIGGVSVVSIKDYETKVEMNLKNHQEKPIELPQSNVMEFVLEDGSSFIMRPSGTEPKMKSYLFVHERRNKKALLDQIKEVDLKLATLEKTIQELFQD
jgi:phosphoglucomutase/phosphomannomutase